MTGFILPPAKIEACRPSHSKNLHTSAQTNHTTPYTPAGLSNSNVSVSHPARSRLTAKKVTTIFTVVDMFSPDSSVFYTFDSTLLLISTHFPPPPCALPHHHRLHTHVGPMFAPLVVVGLSVYHSSPGVRIM